MMKRNGLKLMMILSIVLLLSACMQNANNNTNPNDSSANNNNQVQEEQPKAETIILYYSDSDLMNIYKVKADIVMEENEQIEQSAIDAWLSGPMEAGLTHLLPAGTTAQFMSAEDGVAHVSFSEHIREATVGSGGEAAIVDQITMLMEQFGHRQTQILVDGQVVTELLGHMTYDEPFAAKNQADFEWYAAE